MDILPSQGTAETQTEQDRPSNWSKDFVEHLRTVHFALVLAATILIVTGLDRESQRLSRALIQLQQISSFVKHWSTVPTKVYERALKDANTDTIWGGTVAITGESNSDVMYGEFHVPENYVGVSVANGNFRFLFNFPEEMSTLGDFQAFWNDVIARRGEILIVHQPDIGSKCEVSQRVNGWQKCSLIKSPSSYFATELWPNGPISWHGGDHAELVLWNKRELKGTQEFSYPPQNLNITINIPLTRKLFDESFLQRSFFADWRRGSFDVAFRELNSVSAELSIIPIDEAVQRLATRAAAAEKNVSLLGFNVPVSQLSQWGMLILLTAQFYLWLHLYELSRRIQPNAEGWDVAWIGVYRTRAAVFATVISCLFMPLGASIMLAHRLAQIPFYYRRSMITISIFAIVVSAGLGLLTLWRLRLLRQGLTVKGQSPEPDKVL